ncbi:MAG: hypothetical protein ACXVX9_11230 [Mycobacteriaceae bacterium]
MADDDNDPNDQMLEDSESLDSDELGEGVGDGVADAPEYWAGADRVGTTAREERDGETLDERLAEELPDSGATERPYRPLANTYTEDLDEAANNVIVLGEPVDGEDVAYD